MKISEYRSNKDTAPVGETSLPGFISDIVNGKWQQQTDKVRSRIDTDEFRDVKNALPGVTISGTFSRRANSGIIKHSGFIAIDIDNVDPDEVKSLLGVDQYVYSIFTSVSGRGTCVIFHIGKNDHLESFNGLSAYIENGYGFKVDPSGKDVARFRYVSYDPEAVLNSDYKTFDKQVTIDVVDVEHLEVEGELADLIDQIDASGIDITSEYQDWIRIGFVIADAMGEDGRSYFHKVSRHNSGYNRMDTDKKYNSCLGRDKNTGRAVTINTVYSLAKYKGVDIVRPGISFPIEVFPPDIVNYMGECRDKLHASVDFMGAAMLWLVSTVVGNSMRIKVRNGWYEKATIWVAVVGDAGLGKSPMLNHIIKPLIKINGREIKEYASQLKKYVEYENLKDSEKKETTFVPKPKKRQFIIDDITMEALADLHQENKNVVAMFKDEISGWVKAMNQYRTGADIQHWLTSWTSSGSITLTRKTASSAYVESPNMPVLGGIQPGILETLFSGELLDNGFVERLLISYPDFDIPVYDENELDEKLMRDYDEYVQRMYGFIHKHMLKYHEGQDPEIDPFIVEILPEAKTYLIDVMNGITKHMNSGNDIEYVKSVRAKMKTMIPRLALLLHFLNVYNRDNRPEDFKYIGVDSFRGAVKLYHYFVHMADKAKNSVSGTKKMNRVIEKNVDKDEFEQFKIMYLNNKDLNKTMAAKKIGVSRTAVYNWVKQIEGK